MPSTGGPGARACKMYRFNYTEMNCVRRIFQRPVPLIRNVHALLGDMSPVLRPRFETADPDVPDDPDSIVLGPLSIPSFDITTGMTVVYYDGTTIGPQEGYYLNFGTIAADYTLPDGAELNLDVIVRMVGGPNSGDVLVERTVSIPQSDLSFQINAQYLLDRLPPGIFGGTPGVDSSISVTYQGFYTRGDETGPRSVPVFDPVYDALGERINGGFAREFNVDDDEADTTPPDISEVMVLNVADDRIEFGMFIVD